MSEYKYSPELVTEMTETLGSSPTLEAIKAFAEKIGYSERSVAAKLRNLGVTVPTKVESLKFTAEETAEFAAFLTANQGKLTAEEVAQQFANGKFTSRQVMGKALFLKQTSDFKKTTPKVKAKTYTADEEVTIRAMVASNPPASLEDIAAALNKPVNSVRGKLLSMELKAPQKNKKPSSKDVSYAGIETLAPTMTVEQLVAHYSTEANPKTSRGVKTVLSRRGLSAKDYTPKGGEKAE